MCIFPGLWIFSILSYIVIYIIKKKFLIFVITNSWDSRAAFKIIAAMYGYVAATLLNGKLA